MPMKEPVDLIHNGTLGTEVLIQADVRPATLPQSPPKPVRRGSL